MIWPRGFPSFSTSRQLLKSSALYNELREFKMKADSNLRHPPSPLSSALVLPFLTFPVSHHPSTISQTTSCPMSSASESAGLPPHGNPLIPHFLLLVPSPRSSRSARSRYNKSNRPSIYFFPLPCRPFAERYLRHINQTSDW